MRLDSKSNFQEAAASLTALPAGGQDRAESGGGEPKGPFASLHTPQHDPPEGDPTDGMDKSGKEPEGKQNGEKVRGAGQCGWWGGGEGGVGAEVVEGDRFERTASARLLQQVGPAVSHCDDTPRNEGLLGAGGGEGGEGGWVVEAVWVVSSWSARNRVSWEGSRVVGTVKAVWVARAVCGENGEGVGFRAHKLVGAVWVAASWNARDGGEQGAATGGGGVGVGGGVGGRKLVGAVRVGAVRRLGLGAVATAFLFLLLSVSMFAQVTRGPRRVGDEPTLIVPGAMEEGPLARLSGSGKKDEEGLRQWSPAWPQAPFCALGILVDLRTWLSHLNLSSGSGQIPLISSDHLDSSTERNPLGDFQQRVYEVGLVCLASGIVINFLAVHFWFRRKFLVSMPWYEYHKHGLGLHVIFLLMPPPRPAVRRYANPQACFLFTCRLFDVDLFNIHFGTPSKMNEVLSRIGCLSLLSDTPLLVLKALVYFLDSTGIQAPKVTRVSMGVTVIHLALAPSSKHSLRWPRARLTGFIYEFGLEGNGLPDAELGCEEPLEEFFDALQENVERATLETCQSSGSTFVTPVLRPRPGPLPSAPSILSSFSRNSSCSSVYHDALSEWELDAPVKAQLAHPTGWGRVVQPVILCKEPLSVLLSFLSVGFCLCHGDWHRGQREAERLPILSIACFLGAFAASFLPPRLRPGAREESEDYRRYLQRYKDELRIYIGRFPGEIRNLLDTRTAELCHDKKSKAEKVKTKKEHKSKKEKKKEGKKKQKKPAKESKHHTADEGLQ
ncbi:unnamed protein product, partial [Symbiodinium necroappetens]